MNQNPLIMAAISMIDGQMVEIPAGVISMRDDRKKHRWTVEVNSFLLARYPVTQDVYLAITGELPSTFKGEKRPVETISWAEAVHFCNTLSVVAGLQPCYHTSTQANELLVDSTANGYRLPSEAEWEYACKAGSTEPRYGELDKIAWYKRNADGTTQPVGMKEPNTWGLYDMLGNVWEWCSDVYDEPVYGSYRIFRGGGWFDEPRSCLATNRRRSHPVSFKIDDLGFRLARNLPKND